MSFASFTRFFFFYGLTVSQGLRWLCLEAFCSYVQTLCAQAKFQHTLVSWFLRLLAYNKIGLFSFFHVTAMVIVHLSRRVFVLSFVLKFLFSHPTHHYSGTSCLRHSCLSVTQSVSLSITLSLFFLHCDLLCVCVRVSPRTAFFLSYFVPHIHLSCFCLVRENPALCVCTNEWFVSEVHLSIYNTLQALETLAAPFQSY